MGKPAIKRTSRAIAIPPPVSERSGRAIAMPGRAIARSGLGSEALSGVSQIAGGEVEIAARPIVIATWEVAIALPVAKAPLLLFSKCHLFVSSSQRKPSLCTLRP